ncbi:MAG: ABC transporter permease [Oscillospiraceae bacterium]
MSSQKKSVFKRVSEWFLKKQESSIILILILFITFVVCVNPSFLGGSNVINILRSTGFTLIVVVGMSLVLITGGLDLSVGSVYALGALISAMAATSGVPVPIAIILGLLVGAGIGSINGLLIVKAGMPPLIVTLGMQYMARGLVSVLTKGVPIFPLPESFVAIESAKVFGIIPVIIPIAITIAIVGHIVLSKTVFGRSVYAIGGNPEAARISGINIGRTKMSVYIITGMLAAMAGILMSSRLGSAEPSTGTALEMKVICGAIIGGISTFGGMGTIFGASLGALFMEALTNSLTLMKISVYWQNLVFGAVLIISVLLDQYKRVLTLRQSVKNTEIIKTETVKAPSIEQ